MEMSEETIHLLDMGETFKKIETCLENGNLDAVKALFEANPRHFWSTSEDGRSLWTIALMGSQRLETVLKLYEKYGSKSGGNVALVGSHFPLHMCARLGDVEKFKKLAEAGKNTTDASNSTNVLDLYGKNDTGDTVLHAALHRNEEKDHVFYDILSLLDTNKRQDMLKSRNNDGDTLLHVCARLGKAQHMKALFSYDPDLGAQNREGDTALHILAREIGSQPELTKPYLKVVHLLMEEALEWYCRVQFIAFPESDQSIVDVKKAAAILLLEGYLNQHGYGVIQYAHQVGSVGFLQYVFSLEGIYKVTADYDVCVFDVTNLMPETCCWNTVVKQRDGETASKKQEEKAVNKQPKFENKNAIYPMDENQHATSAEKDQSSTENTSQTSCLEMVVEMKEKSLATKLLDATPMKYLIVDYSNGSLIKVIYVIMLVCHITYMSSFLVIASRDIRKVWRNNTKDSTQKYSNYKPNDNYAWFLVWPGLMALYFVISFLFNTVFKIKAAASKSQGTNSTSENNSACCFGQRTKQGQENTCLHTIYRCWKSYVDIVKIFLSSIDVFRVLGIVFCALTFTWYVYYSDADKNQVYVLGYALFCGWIYSITFLRAFTAMNIFIVTVIYIFLHDLSIVMFVYIFPLLAFSYAFYALFQVSVVVTSYYNNFFDVAFYVFGMFLNTEEMYDDTAEVKFFEDVDSPTTNITTLYVIYVAICTIILFNILIAMMSDSYTNIRTNELTNYRVENCANTIYLERLLSTIPCLGNRIENLLKKQRIQNLAVVQVGDRFYFRMPLLDVDLKIPTVK